MKKIIKTFYVEKLFNRNEFDLNGGLEVHRVDECDPLLISEEKDLVGFRFLEVDEVIIGDQRVSLGIPKQISGMYYFGDRITYKDLVDAGDDFFKKLQLDYLNRFGVEEAIFCEKAGRVISCIDRIDKTMDEVRIERINEAANRMFINQKDFLEGIAEVLEKRHNTVDIIMWDELIPIADCITGEEVDNMESVVRNYDVYINGYRTFSSMGIIGDDRLGLYDKDTYFRLSEASELASSLYQEFPYLEGAMYNLKLSLAKDVATDIKEALTGQGKNKRK